MKPKPVELGNMATNPKDATLKDAAKPKFDPRAGDLLMRAQPGHAERGKDQPRRWYFPGRSPG